MHGFTKNYIRVELAHDEKLDNHLVKVRLGDFNEDGTSLVILMKTEPRLKELFYDKDSCSHLKLEWGSHASPVFALSDCLFVFGGNGNLCSRQCFHGCFV